MQSKTILFNGMSWHVTLRDEADESVAAEIFKLREYRIVEDVIRTSLYPIVDVGAHSGFFTLYARSLNRTVPVIAIEPEPKNLECLKKHLVENKVKGVTIVAAALAEKDGTDNLVLSRDSHNHYLASVEEPSDTNEVVPVATISLATLVKKYKLSKIGLIKMDIEGGEYSVFESLLPEHFRLIEALIMEYHNYNNNNYFEIETKLRENGFGVQIFPSKFDKKMGFLFAKNKRF